MSVVVTGLNVKSVTMEVSRAKTAHFETLNREVHKQNDCVSRFNFFELGMNENANLNCKIDHIHNRRSSKQAAGNKFKSTRPVFCIIVHLFAMVQLM